MSWIPTSILAPLPGRFAHASLVSSNDPQRPAVEDFIRKIYWERYEASLHSFLPHLLAYRDTDGNMIAAVGLRLGSEGDLFVEQYLDGRAEHVIAKRRIANVPRTALAEVGNFAALTPGTARELILQLTWTLHSAHVRWVLFAATKQLRNAFDRLHLSTIELADASADRLDGDRLQWGRYYDSEPRVMCGNVVSGHSYLQQQLKLDGTDSPVQHIKLALAGAL
ncbi:MAG TPA: thermostable hemolysin [Burkholderiaceae bacterium]|nr:thermostable hemolysin [Burkholderiaceae bacterium]